MSLPVPAEQTHLTHPKYRADIDGLRAIAVLSVVGFHAFPFWIKGGFIGVDIFFVISGFLISSIIFANLHRGSFSFIEFYSRRIKRIFPALIVLLTASFIFGWYVLVANEYKQLGKHIAGGAGFIENFLLWSESGYFDNAAETKPLLHLWTLAIEEQFYIIWPLVLWIAWKKSLNLLIITIAVAIISFSLNISKVHAHAVAAFYSPQTRFWELMAGSILAYIRLYKQNIIGVWQSAVGYGKVSEAMPATLHNFQSLFGIVLIATGDLIIKKEYSFPGWWAVLPTLGAVLIISAGPHTWLNRVILSRKILVWFGLISYPLYLWHWPLLSFARIVEGETPSTAINFAVVVISIVLAWITYRLIENPIRFSKRKKFTILLIGAMVSMLLLGGAINRGLLSTRISNPKIEALLTTVSKPNYLKGFSHVPNSPGGVYELNGKKMDVALFIGDSHIEQYGPKVFEAINGNRNTSSKVIFVIRGGCPPIPDVFEDTHKSCEKTRQYGFDMIKKQKVKTVVIGACWACYFILQTNPVKKPGDYNYYFRKRGTKFYFRTGIGSVLAIKKLEDFIHSIGKDKRIVLILDNPFGEKFSPKSFYTGNRLTGIRVKTPPLYATIDSKQLSLREELINIAKRQHIEYVDPAKMFCIDRICKISTNDGTPIFRDNNHLMSFFIQRNASYIDNILRESSVSE